MNNATNNASGGATVNNTKGTTGDADINTDGGG